MVDHKPLVGLLNDKTLDEVANARLFSMKEKMMPWKFTVIYRPGTKNSFADATSRKPCPTGGKDSVEDQEASESKVNSVVAEEYIDITENEQEESIVASLTLAFMKQFPVKAVTRELVKSATRYNETLQQVISLVLKGFPDYNFQLPSSLQDYWVKRESLYVVDDVLMCGKCVVIPVDLRHAILEVLGSAHQGVVAMKARASDAVYWPKLRSDIENF